MGGLILFVVAVAAVALVLLLATHHQEPKKPTKVIVEPLGYLIDHWLLARSFGSTTKVTETTGLFLSANLGVESPLAMILANLQLRSQKERTAAVGLIHQQRLGRISEQRVVERQGRVQSIIVGDIQEMKAHISPTKGSVKTGVSLEECQRQTAMAGANGYLCLTVAVSAIHKKRGTAPPKVLHQLIGGIVLEPHLDQPHLSTLKPLASQPVFLSVLPTTFLAHLFGRIFPTAILKATGATEIAAAASPKEQEDILTTHQIIGEADQKFRYHTILFWQTRYHCQLLSTNPEDSQMPTAKVPS